MDRQRIAGGGREAPPFAASGGARDADAMGMMQLMDTVRFGQGHYLLQSACCRALQDRFGLSAAEISMLSGLPARKTCARLALGAMDAPLRQLLMMQGVPEEIACVLLPLPDEVTRRRVARRIIRDRLCVRDAMLLAASAGKKCASLRERTAQSARPMQGRIIHQARDHRPYLNAIRAVVAQLQQSGVNATLTEEAAPGRVEVHVSLPTRRRRAGRHASM